MFTGKKTYLTNQIKLISLATYDLFTDEEFELYQHIISLSNELEKISNLSKQEQQEQKEIAKQLKENRSTTCKNLAEEIQKHAGKPRTVRLRNILDSRYCYNKDGNLNLPPGITWHTLRLSKKIAEFESAESRAMGLRANEVTFDKIIVKWKSLDVLQQIVYDGFRIPILNRDGSITTKHYRFHTASAGQLRTDKIQCVSDEIWNKIHVQLECGMDWDAINEQKGINCNKYLAYSALATSATDVWNFDIDKCIVIKDFEAPVTGLMKYIKPDYSFEIGEKTVIINHADGCGMMLPCVSTSNFMVRGPYLKGLLSSFDYLHFCEEHQIEPVIKDVWGQEHHLIKEDIQVIFTQSQLKLWKYYKNWEHYKTCFKACKCTLCRTNYEEDWIPDTTINYQMLQTLTDFTDEEVKQFTTREHERISSLTKDKEAMLKTLNADLNSEDPYKEALAVYPELLRDGYSRESLKAIKRRMVLDAKSGRIKCQNKRLFAIPDLYAACEFWFLGIEEPKGLLQDGEIACKIYRRYEKADVLRSPHLYMEHAIRAISHNPNVYKWFYTNGIYTSCHDLISRILQFDVDGDQLNVVVESVVVQSAERNIQEFHIIPLFYDVNKADAEILSKETMFNGLKRAHEYSGIGQISNALTKLWNRENPDWDAAAWLCYYNNLVIDAAKTGKINKYEDYPAVYARINKATGGKQGRMPHFFQFSKNGRKTLWDNTSKQKQYAKPNQSIMNRICNCFDDVSKAHINLNYASIPPFNPQMLLWQYDYNMYPEAVEIFCQLDDSNMSNIIEAKDFSSDFSDKENVSSYDFLKEQIIYELNQRYGNYKLVYPSIVQYLFTGDNLNKQSHKQMFWRIYGDFAVEILKENLENCTVCKTCNQKIPVWASHHVCPKQQRGFFECVDCGTICERTGPHQCRCETCQIVYRRISVKALMRKRRGMPE